ncbi:DUF815 domain-containing protein [Pseudomonas sp. SCB32]|uniref:DUF815 domain-containing protein n=1 Tax=Pseudomonas sp. SCB32 TaxID=2653853 RepID=UPI0021145172|nr:DUF815 domain-containing protein [Pseudomonas sp. SCB32]
MVAVSGHFMAVGEVQGNGGDRAGGVLVAMVRDRFGKASLSERFGLWISFHAFSQERYLEVVARWLESHGLGGVEQAEWEQAAIRWATHRGSRSGRIAAQFARDYAGRRP